MEGPKGRKQQMTVSNDGAVSSWSFNMNEVDNSENEQLQLAVESQFEELECDDAEDAGSIDSDFILIMDLNKLILTHLIIVRHSTAPSDIFQSSHDKPVQPSRSTVTFPPTLYCSKKRPFNPSWYSDF